MRQNLSRVQKNLGPVKTKPLSCTEETSILYRKNLDLARSCIVRTSVLYRKNLENKTSFCTEKTLSLVQSEPQSCIVKPRSCIGKPRFYAEKNVDLVQTKFMYCSVKTSSYTVKISIFFCENFGLYGQKLGLTQSKQNKSVVHLQTDLFILPIFSYL